MAEDAGSIYADVRVRIDKLQADIGTAISSIDKMGTQIATKTENTNVKTQKSFSGMGIAAAAAGAIIAGAFRSAISSFADFQQSMANVQSVTGATSLQMVALKTAAEDAGEKTRFSASQAADALYYLGSAGFSAAQSVDALDGVLSLAQATGSDLAQTADTVSAGLSQFGLAADESGRFANVLAAAIGNSQANLSKLQTAFRQVGPVAGALNISLETTTGHLQALFNAGFQGEQSGTALRAILLELSNASGPTAKKLESLGVAFESIDPTKVGLTQSIETLATSGVKLGEVFGKEMAAQMLVLAETSQKTEGNLRDLEAAVTDTNAAAEMSAIQTDTLAGAFDEFSSTAESAGNKAIESILPFLSGLIELGTAGIKMFIGLPIPIKAFIVTLATLAAGLALASAAATAFGITLSIAIAPVAAIVAAVALIAGIASAIDEASKSQERLLARNAQTIQQYKNLKKESKELRKELEERNKYEKLTGDDVERLIKLYPELSGKLNAYSSTVKDALAAEKKLNIERAQAAAKQLAIALIDAAIKSQKAEEELRARDIQSRKDYGKAIRELDAQIVSAQSARGGNADAIKNLIAERELLLQTQQNLRDPFVLAKKSADDLKKSLIAQAAEFTKSINGTAEKEAELSLAREKDAELQKKRDELRAESSRQDQENAKATSEFILQNSKSLEAEIALINQSRKAQLALTTVKKDIASINAIFDAQVNAARAKSAADVEKNQQEEIRLAKEKNETIAAFDRESKDVEISLLGLVASEQIDYAKKAADITKQIQIDALEERIKKYREAGVKEEDIDKLKAAKLIQINADTQTEISTAAKSAAEKEFEDFKAQVDKFAKYASAIGSSFTGLISSLADLFKAENKLALDALDERQKAEQEVLDDNLKSALEAAGFKEDTQLERIQKELDAAIAAGDTELAEEKQDEFDREVILTAAADKQIALDKKYENEKAQLKYQGELDAWNASLLTTISQGALGVLNAVVSGLQFGVASLVMAPILGGIALTAAGVGIAAVEAQKPRPPTPRAASGGIAIPGSGGAEVLVAENGSPELLLNAGSSGRGFLNQFADLMGERLGAGGGGNMQIMVQIDGQVLSDTMARYVNNGRVELKI